MKASRLLSILMLLQTRGRQSAQALADELEVSVRTIYRDVDHLSASGVPIWAENGRLGGFELQAGWRTQLTGLTVPEARAVFLAGLPGPAAELGLGEAMASAQLKLMAALPDGWRSDADQVASCFHLDPADWYHAAVPSPYLREVAGAVWSRQRIRMRYESWKQVAERTVEPLGLVRAPTPSRASTASMPSRPCRCCRSPSSRRAPSPCPPGGPRPRPGSRTSSTGPPPPCASPSAA